MLKATRQEAALQLAAAGLTTYAYLPERMSVPAAVITPGSPYVEEGETFTEFTVRLKVTVLVRGTNETATDELDELLCSALDELETFDIEAVSEPAAYAFSDGQYLGAEVAIRTTKEL